MLNTLQVIYLVSCMSKHEYRRPLQTKYTKISLDYMIEECC